MTATQPAQPVPPAPDQTPYGEVEKEGQVERYLAMGARVVAGVTYAYVLVVEIILGVGFILLLFGANPSSGFVEWVYRSLDRAMRPFRGIFAPVELGVAGNDVPSVLDTSVLFAMIIYGIVAIALGSLLHWLKTRIKNIDRTNEMRAAEQAHRQQELAYRQAVLLAQRNADAATLANQQPPQVG